jgi:exonuclease SbcC
LVLSFEEHRNNLEDGKPCPLCGSNEHPFAEGNIPSIGTKEQELSNCKSKEQELKNTLLINTQKEAKLGSDIKHAIQNLDKEQSKLSENTEKRNSSLFDIKNKFPDFTLPEGLEKTEFLKNSLQLKREEFSVNEKIIKPADDLKKQIETLQNNLIPKLNEEKQAAERVKFTAENGKSLAAQQLSEKQKTCDENLEIYRNKNNELLQKLERYSVKDLDSLSIRLKEWTDNLKLKDQLKIEINDAKNKIELDNQSLSTTDDKLKNNHKNKDVLESQIKEQKDARREIFGEKSVDEEEQTLNSLLNKARKELSEAEIEKNSANTELEKCRAIISEKEKSLSEKTTNQIFDKSREQLEIELGEKKNAHQELIRKLAIDNKILSDDASNSKNSESKRKEKDQQSAIYWNWANLNTLLGSPDGKKFRNFAQSLTFEHLIALSNQQLQKMSDRYILKRTEAFDNPFQLSVIDRYQNNQERTSENLSGGEKFIVSLSLALGLANMAGKNMRIDTMFIDEGFGTLDSEYLDVAISALSNLQSEGKIIGIISHMTELKDRIATHIEVIPGGNGHSKIQVKY